jgi:flagellar biogenesis protein FliO
MTESLSQLIPALVIFVGGPVLIWWLKRGRPSTGAGLRVTARTALTRNSVIAVIETDGRRILVGATDHGVSVLSDLGSAVTTEVSAQLQLPLTETIESGHDALLKEEHPVHKEPSGPRTSPLEQLRVMTTRRVTRPRPPRVHH